MEIATSADGGVVSPVSLLSPVVPGDQPARGPSGDHTSCTPMLGHAHLTRRCTSRIALDVRKHRPQFLRVGGVARSQVVLKHESSILGPGG